jgi:hypothetical protein
VVGGREKISFTRLIRAAHVSASLRRYRESPSKKITRPLMERTRRWVMASCNNNNIRVSGSLSTPTRAKKNPRNGIFLFYDCPFGPGSSLILAVEWAIHSPVFYAGDLPRVSIGNDKRKTKQIKITFDYLSFPISNFIRRKN